MTPETKFTPGQTVYVIERSVYGNPEDSIDPWEKHCENWRGKNGERLKAD